jgi:hypothetical protein
MKIQIDLKSALVGLALGAGIMFTLGAGASNTNGRYQISSFGNGTGGGAAYVLDTQTGETWGADMHLDWNPKSEHFWGVK